MPRFTPETLERIRKELEGYEFSSNGIIDYGFGNAALMGLLMRKVFGGKNASSNEYREFLTKMNMELDADYDNIITIDEVIEFLKALE
jgi:hypothetical protein